MSAHSLTRQKPGHQADPALQVSSSVDRIPRTDATNWRQKRGRARPATQSPTSPGSEILRVPTPEWHSRRTPGDGAVERAPQGPGRPRSRPDRRAQPRPLPRAERGVVSGLRVDRVRHPERRGGQKFDGGAIQCVNVRSGQVRTLYRTRNGAACGWRAGTRGEIRGRSSSSTVRRIPRRVYAPHQRRGVRVDASAQLRRPNGTESPRWTRKPRPRASPTTPRARRKEPCRAARTLGAASPW